MEISAEINQMVTNLGGRWGEQKITNIYWCDNNIGKVVFDCIFPR